MTECNSCGVQVDDPKQIVCLSCGAIASQPTVETVFSQTLNSEIRERTPYSLLGWLPPSRGVYGRLEFLKGTILLWVVSALGMVLAAMLFQVNDLLGAVTLITIGLWSVIQNIGLLLGRLYDLGCHSMWSRALGVITLFLPIISVITLVLLFLAPRGVFRRGSPKCQVMQVNAAI